MEKTAYLILADGHVFRGLSFGAEKKTVAEVVFTTGMGGYLETLTDKSFYGLAAVHSFPLIGNYGVIPSDFEGDIIGPSAYIVKSWCRHPSNFRSEGDIDTFLKERGVPGIYGIDTRTLIKIIREKGAMNGMLTYEPRDDDLEIINNYRVTNAVESVSCRERYHEKSPGGKFHVALLDYGLKDSIKKELLKRDCDITVCPHDTSPEEIRLISPDGIMLSNGPGDPALNTKVIKNLREIMKMKLPMFGICLGHQLLALANGFTTEKLKYGHRGENQPVKNLENGRVYITCQNHGYAVKGEPDTSDIASEFFININDNTNEGIKYKNAPAFSVQFHPEGAAGPQDTAFLFDEFIDMMKGGR